MQTTHHTRFVVMPVAAITAMRAQSLESGEIDRIG